MIESLVLFVAQKNKFEKDMRKEFKNADGKIEFCDEVVENMWRL